MLGSPNLVIAELWTLPRHPVVFDFPTHAGHANTILSRGANAFPIPVFDNAKAAKARAKQAERSCETQPFKPSETSPRQSESECQVPLTRTGIPERRIWILFSWRVCVGVESSSH